MSKHRADYTGNVRLAPSKDGSCVRIYPAGPSVPATERFKADELEAIFDTLRGSKMPVAVKNVWLAGVKADIRTEFTNKRGEHGERGHAYTAEQIAAFKPRSFKLKSEPNGFGGEDIVLMCFETEWEPATTSRNLKRAEPEKAEPGNLRRR